MTGVDWAILVFVALMAFWGYGQGLIVSGLSLVGFAIGAFLGSRLAPLLLEEGSRSPYAPLFTLFGALAIGAIGALSLEAIGTGWRDRIGLGASKSVDGAGGAILLAALGLFLVWIGGAVAVQTPGLRNARKEIQRSQIIGELNDVLPPSGPILNAIARFDPFPQISGPEADVDAPSAAILHDPDVQAAHSSVVRVYGTACGLAIEGSGWVARPGMVVTNAHVVAGEQDTVIETAGGVRYPAQATAYDPGNDVAVLSVGDLTLPALRQDRDPQRGEAVAILGYPENGPYTATPGRLGTTATVISVDAYGSGPVRRRMTALRGEIRSGNSGGPAVNADGQVTTTVFAATTGRRKGGYGVPVGIVERALVGAAGPVDTGPCAG